MDVNRYAAGGSYRLEAGPAEPATMGGMGGGGGKDDERNETRWRGRRKRPQVGGGLRGGRYVGVKEGVVLLSARCRRDRCPGTEGPRDGGGEGGNVRRLAVA